MRKFYQEQVLVDAELVEVVFSVNELGDLLDFEVLDDVHSFSPDMMMNLVPVLTELAEDRAIDVRKGNHGA